MLLDLSGERYFSLDSVGARIWQLLGEQDGDVDRVVADMLTEFDVDEPTLRRDIDALLKRLDEARLLVAE